MKKALIIFFLFVINANPQDKWVSMNGPYGGYFVYFKSLNDGRLFAGVEFGGGYYSSDSGESWRKLLIDSLDYTLTGIAKNSVDELFATTRNGIYKSDDNGINWEKLFAVDGGFLSIAIDSNDFVYAGCTGALYRSTDSGASWQNMPTGFQIGSCYNIFFSTEGIIYVTTYQDDGLIRSSDNGNTWERLYYGDNWSLDAAINSEGDIFVSTILYLARSTDNGVTWDYLYYTSGFSSYIKQVEIDNNDDIYIGTGKDISYDGDGVYKSTDNGDSWVEINTGINNYNINSLEIDNSGYIFAGSYGELYRSTDNGNSWDITHNGISGTDVWKIIGKDNDLYTIAYGVGTNVFLRSENKWEQRNTGLPNKFISDFVMDSSGNFYCGIYGEGVFKSTDNCGTWLPVNNMVLNKNIRSLQILKGQDIIAGTSYGTYLSNDGGESWGFIGPEASSIISILVSKKGNLFAGTVFDTLFRTTDYGLTWDRVNNGINDDQIRALAENNNFIFSGCGPSNGVYRSSDEGESWQYMNNGLDSAGVTDIAVDNQNNVFASTTHGSSGILKGIYYSGNNGENWQKYNNGLRNLEVRSLFTSNSKIIYAGTECSGVWVTEYITGLNEETGNPETSAYNLSQNYPNPYNPATMINYQLLQNGFVTLKIYNILGKEVATLVNEQKTQGRYSINFDASRLASGVYIYQLRVNDYVSSRKMLLLK